MAIQIDEIQTDVHVPAPEGGAAPTAPALPWQLQDQWRRQQWQQRCDSARTAACGNDSGAVDGEG